MSDFFNSRYAALEPYTPGEQPQGRSYIKLNTNESPYPPSEGVVAVLNRSEAEALRLYSDPTAAALKRALAACYEVGEENVFCGNGSDEALNFAFMAFGEDGIAFPDISYGFYPVFAALNQIRADVKPLKEDFTINTQDYLGIGKALVIANPNAPTGICKELSEIEKIAASNPGHVVIIDEAYIDFGGKTAIPLTKKYKNLLVIQTFSKSRSMAGARVGYAIGDKALISDLETIKYSTNPYNINRLSMAAACAAVSDQAYYDENCRRIIETREWTKDALLTLGFTCLPSKANFLFAAHKTAGGEFLYRRLKEEGILVRHFEKERIRDYNRITIGSREQMEELVGTLKQILGSLQEEV
ncbi:MAG: histidinol-phosphate transaminase [Eubacteriales bacterium]|nr:histidinol-phosphate transaminase [Eubacteriales bacterium]